MLRAQALRTIETLCSAIGTIVTCWTLDECRNYLRDAAYFQTG